MSRSSAAVQRTLSVVQSRVSSALPYLVLLIATALRFHRLDGANVWWDEALAVWATRKGLIGVTLWTAGDVHPPIFFWVLWAWKAMVGESEFALRMLPALCGVLTVAVVQRLGALAGDRRVGTLAAALTATSRFHIWWSQELRMYVLAGLAGTASLYYFLRWVDHSARGSSRGPGVRALAAYVTTTVAAVGSVLLCGALVVAQNLALAVALVGRRRRPPWREIIHWGAAQVTVLAAVGAWLAFSFGRMRTWEVSEGSALAYVLSLWASLVTTGRSVDIAPLSFEVLAPLALLFVGAWSLWSQRRESIAHELQAWTMGALLLASFVPVMAIYAATQPRGLFYTPDVEARYFLPFAPTFWSALAMAVVTLLSRRRWFGRVATVILLVGWALQVPGYYAGRFRHDELQTLVRAIASQSQDGDIVVLDSGSRYPIFDYYWGRLRGDMPLPEVTSVSRAEDLLTPAQVDAFLTDLEERASRVWLAEVDANLSDPDRLVRRGLEARYETNVEHRYGANGLVLFAVESRSPELNIAYQPQHRLATEIDDTSPFGWELPVARISAGSPVYVSLLWHSAPVGEVRVGLYDRRDRLLVERMAQPAQGAIEGVRQQFDLAVGRAVPQGRYTARISAPEMQADLGHVDIYASEALEPESHLDDHLSVRLGGAVELVGYRLRDERGRRVRTVEAGETLVLDLYWRSLAKLAEDYTVFAHLLGHQHNPGTNGPVWGQDDSEPAGGGYPTSQWLIEDTIVDRHEIVVDGSAPEGPYEIEVGMYRLGDGKRLPVIGDDGTSQGDHVVLHTPVRVRR